MRSFLDLKSIRQAIFDRAKLAAGSISSLQQGDYSIKLDDIDYDDGQDPAPEDYKMAIMEGKSLVRPLRATVMVQSPAGPIKKRTTLLHVPYLTDRGTFILDGIEYVIANQQRLRPGVYVHFRQTGEPEAYVNLAAGRTHRIVYDPNNRVFSVQFGQSKIPLYPVLRALGIDDASLQETWGKTVWQANSRYADQKYAQNFAKRLFGDPNADIRKQLVGLKLDPGVVERNLGVKTDALTPDVILAATRKALTLLQGQASEDDRDALINQQILGPEDIVAEYIAGSRKELQRTLWKIFRRPSKEAIPPRLLQSGLVKLFQASGLAMNPAENNPIEILDHLHRLTRMGEGGIGNVEAIPYSARDVHATHFGYIDPTTTPESLKVGVETRLTIGAVKGDDGKLYSPFKNIKTGKQELLSPDDVYNAYVTFPGELESGRKMVRGFYRGKETLMPASKVQYVLPAPQLAFGPLSSIIPFKSATFPQRIAMGSRFLSQALPLVRREAPLVQSLNTEGKPFVEQLGEFAGAVRSPVEGVVKSVSEREIVLQDQRTRKERRISLYRNVPYARQTVLNNEPLVKPGDKVSQGQLLAKSNYTDDQGRLALGVNAKIAYMATGDTYEDAFTVSESFARRLSSEHALLYQHEPDKQLSGKKAFISLFPTKYDREKLANYNEYGLPKPGTVLGRGDPVILSAQTLPITTTGVKKRTYVDNSLLWEHDQPGVVVDSVRQKNGQLVVLVKAVLPMEHGDKIAGLYGNKGVVIVKPDSQMPRGEDGQPVDVVASPFLISRANIGQVYEALLGKAAKKAGKPFYVEDFKDAERLHELVESELQKHGIKPTEKIYDPITGRTVEAVTGYGYILKLCHTAEEKLQGVGSDVAYTSEDTPGEGKEGRAKRVGWMELNALLSHGAYANITDASLFRGQKDEELWRRFLSGHSLPPPKTPQMWDKFLNMLRGAGINPVQERNGAIKLMALRQQDLDTLCGNRFLENSDTLKVVEDQFKPVPGGLFDEKTTGGLNGQLWSAIRLPEMYPNPVMATPLAAALGMPLSEFELVLIGKKELPKHLMAKARTGPAALYEAASNIRLDQEIQRCEDELKSARGSKADALIKRLSYLRNMEKLKIHPRDLFWDRCPVLPPKFRPISALSDGALVVNDANYLYKELMEVSNNFEQLKSDVDDLSDERLAIWRNLKGVCGVEDPPIKHVKVKGILAHVVGNNPKEGIVQRKLLGGTATLSGRAVISPNSSLDIDEIGLPEEMAWRIYKPFVVRELVRRGLTAALSGTTAKTPLLVAMEMVEKRDRKARAVLEEVVRSRPVIVNRAPILHKYGIMAFKPVLTRNKTLEISPLVTSPFGADFDGDTMQLHVPISEEAVKEAYEKLLPSRNLFSAARLSGPVYKPSQDFLYGLWKASQSDKRKPVRVFQSLKDALAAYRRGELTIDQPIRVLEEERPNVRS